MRAAPQHSGQSHQQVLLKVAYLALFFLRFSYMNFPQFFVASHNICFVLMMRRLKCDDHFTPTEINGGIAIMQQNA